ncbi:uncharacterized protein LOC105200742 isoform X2 [Solenopsis invicta]|uniref:uncharacterized protein LOC105200742 isoform X2 n=1 Tax=Solenopsis invicta TaxID=13686 RepID=UPI00193D3B0B|nr:uncharacterized protein LOC105200742 isoform X2 [Solenopsis invicta]
MVELPPLPADLLRAENETRVCENSPLLLYPDATYNVRDFISREDNESLDKSYGDGSRNEICAFKLDQGKIDELANDYRAETCVSFSRESAIQKESCEEAVKSDGTPSRNEDESRCKSNRRRKTRRRLPDGVIIDLSNDVCGTSRGGMRISVISMNNLVPDMKFVATPKKQYSTTWNSSLRNKAMKKMIDNSILTVLCGENCSERKKSRRSRKRRYKNFSRKSLNNVIRRNANTTDNVSKKFENIEVNEQRELHVENNMQSLCTSNEIFGSTQCCHHDNTLVDIDNARYPISNTEQTCVGARKHIVNYCCSIFNDKHQEYHICDREDYNADSSDFNAEMQADWTVECFHPEYTRAKGCRCFYDSSECDPDVNMQRDCCSLTSRMVRLFENSPLPRKHQREEVERLGSDGLWTDIAPEFATKADEYLPDGVERCMNCEANKGSSTSTILIPSVLAEPGSGSVADLRDSLPSLHVSRCEIDTRPGKHDGWTMATTTAAKRDDDRSYKSDSLKAADTWDTRARRDNCIEWRCAGRVVAESSRPGEKGGSTHEVDSEWKRSSIETDAQQLDYKWKRRIATVDAGTHARVDFKRKRDSRSQTRSDNTNADDKRRETRDYSLWTSLQMGKIWSQVHDAWKNVVKLATTSVGRVVKDAAPQSECSQRNPVEVADVTLVESSSPCADEICGETCRKNLMRSKSEKKTEARLERTIGDVGKYRWDTEAPMREDSRVIAPSHRDMRKHACKNAEKEKEESYITYSGTINSDPFPTHLPVALTESSKLATYI